MHCRHLLSVPAFFVQHVCRVEDASHDPYVNVYVPVESLPVVLPLRTHVVPDRVHPLGHEYSNI